jgi:hypothetical protein
VTTVSSAHALIKARIEANPPSGITVLRWQNEDGVALPDTPTSFLYTELVTDPQFLAGFGGGFGANLWRNPARIDCYAFVPRGEGLAVATDLAESVAALFRGYRSSNLQCFDATVYPLGAGSSMKPPGLSSEVDNYFCAVCEVRMHFDLIG